MTVRYDVLELRPRPRDHRSGASKRSPEREEAILRTLCEGMTKHAAAGSAGITVSTLNAWIESDDAFAEKVEVATNFGERELLSRIATAGSLPQNWTANAWILERTRQKRYALRAKVGQDDDTAVLTHALADEIRRRMAMSAASAPASVSAPQEPAGGVAMRTDYVEAESRPLPEGGDGEPDDDEVLGLS